MGFVSSMRNEKGSTYVRWKRWGGRVGIGWLLRRDDVGFVSWSRRCHAQSLEQLSGWCRTKGSLVILSYHAYHTACNTTNDSPRDGRTMQGMIAGVGDILYSGVGILLAYI